MGLRDVMGDGGGDRQQLWSGGDGRRNARGGGVGRHTNMCSTKWTLLEGWTVVL